MRDFRTAVRLPDPLFHPLRWDNPSHPGPPAQPHTSTGEEETGRIFLGTRRAQKPLTPAGSDPLTVERQRGTLCSAKKERTNIDAWLPPQEIPVYLVWDMAWVLDLKISPLEHNVKPRLRISTGGHKLPPEAHQRYLESPRQRLLEISGMRVHTLSPVQVF